MKREPKQGNPSGPAVQFERAVLGVLVERPDLLPEAGLSPTHFLLSDHQKLYSAMCELRNFDVVQLAAALDGKVDAAYIGTLFDDGYIDANFPKYVTAVRQAALDRQFARLREQLDNATNGDRLPLLQQMQELLTAEDSADWRSVFHTYAEFEDAAPLTFCIHGFLPADGITAIAGLSGHGKTLAMLAMTRSLLTGEALFGWAPFSVPKPASRVCYLIPESSISPFWQRLKLFRLEEFLRDGRLLVRTLSHREQSVGLDDPRILQAAKGADIFLDTAARFLSGTEDAEASRIFANTLFALLAAGARSVVGAHHAPKGFQESHFMTVENILRGSGDLGAMLSAAWGLRQIDSERNAIFVDCVKARDFEACPAFLLEARPHLNETGSFKMLEPPGRVHPLRHYLDESKDSNSGRPATPDKDAKIAQAVELRARGMSLREIAQTVKAGKSSVERWLFDFDSSQKCPTGTGGRDSAEPRTEMVGGASPKDSTISGLVDTGTVP